MERWNLEPPMETQKNTVRTLSIGRALHHRSNNEPVRTLPERVPGNTVASDRSSTTQDIEPDEPRGELLIALHIETEYWPKFALWVGTHIRVSQPIEEKRKARIIVVPDLGGDVDFDQYGPPPTITIDRIAKK